MDAKLVRLARNLNAKLFTNDHNLGKIAALQNVTCINLHELARMLKPVLLAGDPLALKIVRERQGQRVRASPTARRHNGRGQQRANSNWQQVEAVVQNVVQTGAGVIVFADLRSNS